MKGIRPRHNSIQIDFYYQGLRCRETLSIEPTKKNLKFAEQMKAAIKHEIALGTFDYAKHFPNSPKVHLGKKKPEKLTTLLNQYIKSKERTLAASTLREYRSSIEYHLRPFFGGKYIHEIHTSEIRDWIATLDISNKRINNILVPLRGVFRDAFMDGRIDKNPMDRIKNLSVQHEEPNPLVPDQIVALLHSTEGQVRNLFQFAVWTGLRTSELISLEWSDIDWEKMVVRVQRARVRNQIKVTKTKAGKREVMLFDYAKQALISQKQFTAQYGKEVFHNPQTGKRWNDDAQIRNTAWKPALKRAGIEYRNPYQTRHTYASMMLSAGEEPLWVAQQMGHKDWAMIRKHYGRWIPEVQGNAGRKIMQIWSQSGHGAQISD